MEKFDIFGTSPKLYFQGKGTYQTKFGSFLTIVTGCFILLAFVFYGSEIFTKQNPLTVYTEEFIRQPEKYEFKKKKNSIAIGLQNFKIKEVDVHFFDESIYSFQFENVIRKKFFNETTQKEEVDKQVFPIKARRCQESDFQVQGTETNFKNLRFLNDLYCIDNFDNHTIQIEGDFAEDKYSYLRLKALQCKNSTENGHICKPQETIDKYLENGFWAIYFTDQIVNPKDYSNPFEHISRDIYSSSSNKLRTLYTLFFKNVYMESDTGLLWSNKEYNRGLQFNSESKTEHSKPKKNGEFLTIDFRFEKFKQTRIFRSYINLGQVLAQIGGISKMVLMLFWVFSYFFVEKDYHIQILNRLFTFIPNDQNNFQAQKKETSNNLKFQYKKQESKDKINFATKKKFQDLNLSSLKLLFAPCLGKKVNQEKKLLKTATQRLHQNLDVVKILNKLQEFDKMKELLFTKEQKQILEHLPKPVIKEDEEQSVSKSNKNTNNEIFTAYKSIKSKKINSDLDKKVLELLDTQIRSNFDRQLSEFHPETNVHINLDSYSTPNYIEQQKEYQHKEITKDSPDNPTQNLQNNEPCQITSQSKRDVVNINISQPDKYPEDSNKEIPIRINLQQYTHDQSYDSIIIPKISVRKKKSSHRSQITLQKHSSLEQMRSMNRNHSVPSSNMLSFITNTPQGDDVQFINFEM